MATMAGQRAQFTYALNQYNRFDDPDTRRKFVQAMAKVIADAPIAGSSIGYGPNSRRQAGLHLNIDNRPWQIPASATLEPKMGPHQFPLLDGALGS